MVSGGGAPRSGGTSASPDGHRSWANVLKHKEVVSVDPPPHINQKENLEKNEAIG